MKDLYTFDSTTEDALTTYDAVNRAYVNLFNDFKLPFLVAAADSGDMGGNLSHEYHLLSSKGEDTLVQCDSCKVVANEEVVGNDWGEVGTGDRETRKGKATEATSFEQGDLIRAASPLEATIDNQIPVSEIATWTGVTKDKLTLVSVLYPKGKRSNKLAKDAKDTEVNIHAVKQLVPDLDAGIENPIEQWRASFKPLDSDTPSGTQDHSRILQIIDKRLHSKVAGPTFSNHADLPIIKGSFFSKQIPTTLITQDPTTGSLLNLLRIRAGDKCPHCKDGRLHIHTAIEVGHTFYLGTRYSALLDAVIPSKSSEKVSLRESSEGLIPIEMGCHGIGVSRLIGTVAELLYDEQGLNWPRLIAPFEVAIVASSGLEQDAEQVYDTLVSEQLSPASAGSQTVITRPLDVVLDDREKDFIWKLKDADLIGVPVIIVLGRSWKKKGLLEVQCRRLDQKSAEIRLEDLGEWVQSRLARL
jgi:prolyl-tRNA synthetase